MTVLDRAGTWSAALAVATLLVACVNPAFADAAGSPDRSAAANNPASAMVDDDIAFEIRKAIVDHNLDFFEKRLVDWDGARKRTQRLTLFQIRECFGRPIKSVRLELLKPDPAAPLVPDGYRTNIPVTHLLRIAFDEQHAPDETPSCVFMLSKDPDSTWHMALVLPNEPPSK